MNFSYYRRERGLTLIELMIAMVIGLVLMGGIFQIFTGSKVSYLTQEELGRIQENARYAVEVLSQDIRMAGYLGCYAQTNINDIVKPSLKPGCINFFTDPIMPFDAQSNSGTATSDWSPNLPSFFAGGQSIAGSDVIVIQRAEPLSTTLTGNMTVTNANVQLTNNPNNELQAGDTLFLSDCVDTDIFMATNVSSGSSKTTIAHSSAKNTGNFLSKAYGPNARLMKMIMNAYYVGTNADGNRALYRSRLGTNGTMTTEELVEGVETLQIAYGEDLTGDGLPNRYVPAGNVTTADNIVTVRIGLLMYTLKEVATVNDARSFNVAGTAVADTGTTPTHGGDRALRQVYSATIKIRNRGIQ